LEEPFEVSDLGCHNYAFGFLSLIFGLKLAPHFGRSRKGTLGLIEINNPNLVKPKNLKAKDADVSCHTFKLNTISIFLKKFNCLRIKIFIIQIRKITELSRRERLPTFLLQSILSNNLLMHVIIG
jgi:hypothetical protein